MSPYAVTHLRTGDSHTRPSIFLNSGRSSTSSAWHPDVDPAVEALHQQLPEYGETKLHSLPTVAAELGFPYVFLKDESTRFGLPSFKILGASWAVHRALCQHVHLPSSTTLADLKQALSKESEEKIRLVSCTEGNWGRALARMAKYLNIPATIYVPGFMNAYTRALIRGEGADLRVLDDGTYDDTIAAVQSDTKETGSLMVMDTSWPGYEQIPGWVTEGYSTLLRETDRQVAAHTGGGKMAMLAVAAVGVGSWAHAVVAHYKAADAENAMIVSVEPEAAASLKESLHCGEITSVVTGETIMDGMNCGTTSDIAWPVLRNGVHAAVAISDMESHRYVQELRDQGLNVGPCGAATLAALKKLCSEDIITQDEGARTVVVLFSTEGGREYRIPNA